MKLKLLDYLVCPLCKNSLQCVIDQEDKSLSWSEILEGHLTCKSCTREYQIKNGVPRMIAGELPKVVQKTVAGFGWEWLSFDEQIQDTYMTSKDNFLAFIHPTTESFFHGKFVLDAGCGMGRFLKLAAEFGSREVIGVDLSNSVEAAYRNTRALGNAHVVQCDILSLPFIEKFDYIFSIGVLHHMEDPKKGFSCLAKLLNKGGKISIWIYSKENNGWVRFFISPIRKYVTSHLPKPVLYTISLFLGAVLYFCLNFIYKPANDSRLGLKLGSLLPYNAYLYSSSRLTYTALVSIIFDHLVPQLASYIPRKELECWFREEKLAAVMVTSRNNMSWRGEGTLVDSLEST